MASSCKKGETGAPGKDGNTNVTSHTYTITSWDSNSVKWYTDLGVSELTSSNINSASVQVYFGTVSNNWVALPYTQVSSTNYFMGYITAINTVEITWVYNGGGIGSSPNSFYGTNTQFKVVIIPPAMIKANPDLDFKNYNEVKTRFSIKD